MTKKILSVLIVLFMFVMPCFAQITSSKAKYLKSSQAYVKLNTAKTAWSIYPSLVIDEFIGSNNISIDMSNDGFVDIIDANNNSAYLNYKNCYGEAKYETSITDSSFHTLYIFTSSVYKKIEFLQDTINSGTNYITWADNDSTYGSCFTIGKYGAGVYEIAAELEGTASISLQCYAVIYVNGVIKATSWGTFTSIGRCTPVKQIYLNVGDVVSLGFTKRALNQNDNVAFREVSFRLKRISQ